MKEKVKTLCFFLIAFSLSLIAGSYIWKSKQELIIEKEKLDLELKKYKLESCVKGGRYMYRVVEGTGGQGRLPDVWTEWWAGRWNFEREECEKEEAKYGERGIKKE